MASIEQKGLEEGQGKNSWGARGLLNLLTSLTYMNSDMNILQSPRCLPHSSSLITKIMAGESRREDETEISHSNKHDGLPMPLIFRSSEDMESQQSSIFPAVLIPRRVPEFEMVV